MSSVPTGKDAPFPTDDEGLPISPQDVDQRRVEQLAAHCHDKQWSGWMKYLFSKCEQLEGSTIPGSGSPPAMVIPSWAVKRWMMQMNTPCAELPEEMKESDREEARAILKLLD